jgi:hypothetical protein
MPADLTREEIERMRDLAAMLDTEARATMTEFGQAERLLRAIGRVGPQWVALVDSALSEPTRLAQARAEGYREGVEAAARLVDQHYPLTNLSAGGVGGYDTISATIRALTPPPAEPSQPDGWVEWKGGERPVPPKTFVEVRLRDVEEDEERGPADAFDWTHQGDPHPCDVIAYRVQSAEPSAPVAEPITPEEVMQVARCVKREAEGAAAARITALEAENAALKADNARLREWSATLRAAIGSMVEDIGYGGSDAG